MKVNPEFFGIDTLGDARLESMLSVCGEFARAFDTPGAAPRWLTLLGPSGTGKTHCAYRLWRWMDRQRPAEGNDFAVRPIVWPVVIVDIRNRDDEAIALVRDARGWPTCVIDDVGGERDSTGFSASQLLALLISRERRWTILTSNLSVGQLAEVDPRIADRVLRGDNLVSEIVCPSYAIRVRRTRQQDQNVGG